MDSIYGWVGKVDSTSGQVFIHLKRATPISGIFHAGATVGDIGVTHFTVKYANTVPPSFVHSAHSQVTGSNVFTSQGDNCKIEFSSFETAYVATALLITPTEWKQDELINAPGMRVALQICSI
jgi:hypothetical protein